MKENEWELDLIGQFVGDASIICEQNNSVLRVVRMDGEDLDIDPDLEDTTDVTVDRDIIVAYS